MHNFLISIFYVSYFLNRNELENESKNFSVDVNANEVRHGPSSRVTSIFAPFFTHRSPASAKYVQLRLCTSNSLQIEFFHSRIIEINIKNRFLSKKRLLKNTLHFSKNVLETIFHFHQEYHLTVLYLLSCFKGHKKELYDFSNLPLELTSGKEYPHLSLFITHLAKF